MTQKQNHRPNLWTQIVQAVVKARPIHITLLTGFSSLLIFTVVTILLISTKQHNKLLYSLTNEIISHQNQTVLEKTEDFFSPVKTISNLIQQNYHHQAVGLDNPEKFSRLGITVLQEYSHIYAFYYADKKGRYLAIQDTPDGFLLTKILPFSGKNKVGFKSFKQYVSADGNLLGKPEQGTTAFDHRKQPWFEQSIEKEAPIWTDAYIFHTLNKPGITYASPHVNADEVIDGVFGLDLKLGEISVFLHSQKKGVISDIFIVDDAGKVIAYPDVRKLIKNNGKEFQQTEINDLTYGSIQTHLNDALHNGTQKTTFSYEGNTYYLSFSEFPESFSKPWNLALIVETSKVLGTFAEKNRDILLISFLILMISIYLTIQLSHSISKPIMDLAEEANKIKDLNLTNIPPKHSFIWEINHMNASMAAMKHGLKAFEKYVPSKLVRKLIKEGIDIELGGTSKQMTMFFSDIASFTSITETTPADELMHRLSDYLDIMAQEILCTKGTVDKYIGDAVMAFWGAPVDDTDQAINAAAAALNAMERLNKLNKKWKQNNLPPFETRIGIHTGDSIVGNIGSSTRMNYTVIGDSVNLASRLEGINKYYGTNIIISETTYRLCKDKFYCRPLDIVAVKGKQSSIKIYELLGFKENKDCKLVAMAFNKILGLYFNRQWREAITLLENLKKVRPNDKVIDLYLDRCEALLQTPPPLDWNGIYRLDSK